ncbi:hypothetical protein BM613_04640 [Sulfoacidibacillus thermotolerans]|uniref:DHH family phosphoesterase n=1 Tax=Sulfoacidibacillus thermotolerans TaxID=1765684 RepID=A0A2U3DAD8_SULT2|nr:hypothetical protein BM613_04640 [Sulfoacidibacillus thermotolerans]
MRINNVSFQAIYEALRVPSDPLLIICHVSPDGDAIGAALAVAHLCDTFGRPCVLVNDDEIPERYQFLPGVERFLRTSAVTEFFQYAVAVDCADLRRLGEAVRLIAPNGQLINIDHHGTNNHFGTLNLVQAEASATCLVLYRFIRANQLPMNRSLALVLYTGIVFDTGGFHYNNTTPEIHLAAADLLSYDIEPFLVADRVLEAMTREQIELVRLGLSTLTVHESGLIAYVAVDQSMLKASGARDGDVEVLLPYPRTLVGVEVGLLFRERPDGMVKVSLRSREFVDVAQIALVFGGGGHVRAAGCEVPGPLQSAVQIVMKEVEAAVHETLHKVREANA